jgi:hypothetical protein
MCAYSLTKSATDILAPLARQSRKVWNVFLPLTQGVARGLALPWAIILRPFGAGRFFIRCRNLWGREVQGFSCNYSDGGRRDARPYVEIVCRAGIFWRSGCNYRVLGVDVLLLWRRAVATPHCDYCDVVITGGLPRVPRVPSARPFGVRCARTRTRRGIC